MSRVVVFVVMLFLLAAAPLAQAAQESRNLRVTASDGVSLAATLTGEGPIAARPTIVEFSPYGRGTGTLDPGPDYNFLLVQIRGTGDSDGRFDALGPRTQQDVADVLGWACEQPWSAATLGLNGFSASAITIYNSLHLELPCVEAAVLKSGTFELYRDLIWPGGISNTGPGAGVMAVIGAPALIQGGDRLGRNPVSGADVAGGLLESGLSGLTHATLDSWWRERGFRGDVNHLPVLMIGGFFDVESRGAFQGYQGLRDDGARLIVPGAHDAIAGGTDGGISAARAWLDRHLRDVPNGVEQEPRVELWLADGRREDVAQGRHVHVEAEDWPVPGTRWASLALGDGSLTLGDPGGELRQAYPTLPSPPTMTDVPTTALIGAAGFDALSNAFPMLTRMNLAEPLGLAFTTRPFAQDVLTAGPASLELRLASTAPETGIWVVISDVAPDGAAHPVATGRLSTAYPHVDEARSLVDPDTGAVVQPYGVFDQRDPAPPGTERLYRVELWPIGNRFKRGHRLRLHVVGASAFSMPGLPAANIATLGGASGSRLLLPVLPGSDIETALEEG